MKPTSVTLIVMTFHCLECVLPLNHEFRCLPTSTQLVGSEALSLNPFNTSFFILAEDSVLLIYTFSRLLRLLLPSLADMSSESSCFITSPIFLPHYTAIRNNKTQQDKNNLMKSQPYTNANKSCPLNVSDKNIQPCRTVLQQNFWSQLHTSQQPCLAILPCSLITSLWFATAALSKLIRCL